MKPPLCNLHSEKPVLTHFSPSPLIHETPALIQGDGTTCIRWPRPLSPSNMVRLITIRSMTRSFTPPLPLSLSYVHDPRTSLFPFRYRGGLTIARGDGRGSLSLSPILVTIIRAIVLVIIIALVIIEDPRCRPCYQRERGAAVTPVIGLSLPRYSSPYSNANSNVICRYTAYVIDRFTNRSWNRPSEIGHWRYLGGERRKSFLFSLYYLIYYTRWSNFVCAK